MRQMPFQLDPDDSTSRILNGGVGRDEEDSVPGSPKRSVSSVFLTGGSDESIENSRAERKAGRKASAPQAGSPAPSPSPPSPVGVTLPPIVPSSRGSSAGGGSRPDPFEVGKPRIVAPDGGVREAMRALRAAAMSEYAVAA